MKGRAQTGMAAVGNDSDRWTAMKTLLRLGWLLVAGVVVFAVVKGSTDGPTYEAPAGATGPATTASGSCVTASSGHEFCDETSSGGFDNAGAYRTAKLVCEGFSVKEVAKEFHTRSDPVDAGLGYATQFEGSANQAAYEGCLDGFG